MLNKLLIAWAFLGVPLLFGIYVWGSYYYALSQGGLPLSLLPPWQWIAAFGVSASSGVFSLFALLDRLRMPKAVPLLVYGVVVCLINFLVHAAVACGMGDCL